LKQEHHKNGNANEEGKSAKRHEEIVFEQLEKTQGRLSLERAIATWSSSGLNE